MSLRLNDTAPDFAAETTQGKINFHEWIGDKWAILFSHPKDFTPVCTTELGYMAKIEPEFTKRNAKLIGLSVDPSEAHGRWLKDIEETQGAKVNYPIIADHDLKVSSSTTCCPPRSWEHSKAGRRRRTKPSAPSTSSGQTKRSSSCLPIQ
jgi:thioredoxin-dependent peroxiredoxin